jgi:hypothetical protein
MNRGPTNVMRQRTKFSRHEDLASGVCAPFVYNLYVQTEDNYELERTWNKMVIMLERRPSR